MNAKRYYVKRPTGKVFGPFEANAIGMMLKSNKLGADAQLSEDKVQWMPLTQIPELAGMVSQDAYADLPQSAGNMDLPVSAGSQGYSDLPRPVGPQGPVDLPVSAGSQGYSDLPRPAGVSDLPRPVTPGGPPDLPRSAGGPPNLPRSAGGPPNLPRSAGGPPNLPQSAGGPPNLPQSAGVGLPQSAGVGLPQSAGTGLPQSAGTGLPQSAGQNLPQASSPANLPQTSMDEDDLFGAPSAPHQDDLFGPGPSVATDDDLFGAPAGGGMDEDDLFGPGPSVAADEDDLFGAPSGGGASGMDEDDLFGGPAAGGSAGYAESEALFDAAPSGGMDEDDLFGAPSSSAADDDLFGAPAGGGGHGGGDDLFGDGGGGDDDDFLGGGQGFSFLDSGGAQKAPTHQAAPSNPAPQASAPPPAQDGWGDDLLSSDSGGGSGDWEDELLMGNNAAPAQPASGGGMSVDMDIFDDVDDPYSGPGAAPGPIDDPFRPASTGYRPPPPEPEPQPEVTEGTDDKKRGMVALIGVPLVAIVVLSGVGYGVYSYLSPPEATGPKIVKRAYKVPFAKVKSATHAELKDIFTQAKKNSAGPDQQARLLIAYAVFMTRYTDEAVAKDAAAVAGKVKGANGESRTALGAFGVATGKRTVRDQLDALSEEGGDVGLFAQTFAGISDVLEIEKTGLVEADQSKDEPKEAAPTNDPKEAGGDEAPAEEGEGAEGEADMAEAKPEPEPEKKDDGIITRARATLTEAMDKDAALPGYWLGRLEETLGNEKDAIKAYDASIKTSVGFVPSLVALGRLYYAKGDLNQASEHLERVNKDLAAMASPTERGAALHFMGMVHSARSQSDLAIASFTKALSVDASRTDTLRALAEEYERAQKYKEALNFFKTNESLGKKDPEVMLGIVRAHMGLKEWPAAIAQLEVGEKGFPTDARFPFYLGLLNMRRGTFFEAQQALERAVEIDPKLLLAHATLAQLAWRTEKDAEKGQQYVSRVVEYPELITAQVATEVAEFYRMATRREAAKKWYRFAIDKDTNYWPARLALSKLLLESDQTQRALKLLERSREEGVQDIRLSAYLADAYRQSKLYDRAIDEINRVIEKFPKNPDYIFIRGRIYFDRGNYDTALEDFNKAYDLNPRFHEAYFYVGRTAFAQEDTGTALKIFRHVLDYQPNNGEFRFFMGQALQREKRQTQALEEYRKVTEVDPGYGIRNPQVYIKRGRLLSLLGYSREGKRDIARALELAPDMEDALIAMGEASFRDKEYEASIKHFSKALEKNPEYPDAQFKLGMSHVYLREETQGAKHLQQAIVFGYEDPDVYRTLGYIYKDLSKRKDALQAFETYIEKTASNKAIPRGTLREVLRQIEDLK